MNARLFPALKFSAICLASLLLVLSLLSASFYDPTFFHQLYPAQGIKNWCGILGALIGGTLMELFGPASFLIPWCTLRMAYSPRPMCLYDTFVLLLFLSTSHALWFPVDFGTLSEASFLHFPGYVGILGGQWLLKFFPPLGANIFLGSVIFVCGVRIFEGLPMKLLTVRTLHLGIVLTFYLVQKIWQSLCFLSQWGWARFLQIKHRSPSSFSAEHPPSPEDPSGQNPHAPAKNPMQSPHDKPRPLPRLPRGRASGWNDRVRH